MDALYEVLDPSEENRLREWKYDDIGEWERCDGIGYVRFHTSEERAWRTLSTSGKELFLPETPQETKENDRKAEARPYLHKSKYTDSIGRFTLQNNFYPF